MPHSVGVRCQVAEQVAAHRINGLLMAGGWAGYQAAHELHRHRQHYAALDIPIVCLPMTINNDVPGTELSIGSDTALNSIVADVDKIRQSAVASRRVFVVEVMGRDCGYLALAAAVAGGAEAAIIPEMEMDPETLAEELRGAYQRGKLHALVVVAEGSQYNAERLMRYFAEHRQRLGFELRATILGHVQRGGTPGAFDRLLATRLGAAAVERLAAGEKGVLVGLLRGQIATTPLSEVVANKKPLDLSLLELARVLAR
jgi:6-phosphofructokinase 1